MRIDATNRSGNVAGRSSTGKAGNGPAFVPAGEQGPQRVSATAPSAPTTGIDAILALQASGDYSEGRRKAVKQGTRLLDLLEEMKADLLIGKVSPERLDVMASQVRNLRERVEPELDAVLDDIELRVLVELAKLGRYPQI